MAKISTREISDLIAEFGPRAVFTLPSPSSNHQTPIASRRKYNTLRCASWNDEDRLLHLCIGPCNILRESCLKVSVFIPPESSSASPMCFVDHQETAQVLGSVIEELNASLLTKQLPLFQIEDRILRASESWCQAHPGEQLSSLCETAVRTFQKDPLSIEIFGCLFHIALRGYRRSFACQPFPPFFKDSSSNHMFDELEVSLNRLLSNFPLSRPDILDREQALLLQWLADLGSATYSSKKKSHDAEKQGCPDYVFTLQRSTDPEFDRLGKKHGIAVGYHGSSAENMHSILRCGLINFSGTERMRTGDAFGEGIYLSSNESIAKSFSRSNMTFQNCSLGKRVSCVAVCEVVLHPDVNHGHDKNGSKSDSIPTAYYLIPHSDYVRVIGLHIYTEGAHANESEAAEVGKKRSGNENSTSNNEQRHGGRKGKTLKRKILAMVVAAVIMGVIALFWKVVFWKKYGWAL